MKQQDEDETEMRGVASGDAEAFSRVYHKYRDRVYGFAYRMLGSRSIAEDITHEAFLALIEHPERFKPELGSLTTFLCAVARHSIFNHYRNCGTAFEDFVGDEELESVTDESAASALSALLDKELGAKIRESIAALPALQREAIILREFQDLSYDEISAVAGADPSVVKARIYRARRTLEKNLEPYLATKGEVCYEVRKS